MQKDDIINDLIRRKPKGPEGVSIDYETTESFSWEQNKYVTEYIPSIPCWGYTDDELFSLGFASRNDVEVYLRERDFEGKSDWTLGRTKATLSRRTNNVWNKLADSVSRVVKQGRPGIYEVTVRHSRTGFGHLYAESTEEARQNANLFFGYLSQGNDLRVHFIKMGTADDLTSLNAETKKRIERVIESTQNEIDRSQAMIESLNSRLSTMRIVEQQQIAVEMVNAMDEKLSSDDNEEVTDQNEQS